MKFKLKAPFKPTGDQPLAIEKLLGRIKSAKKESVLLGVTGSGKTFTLARVINQLNRPVLVISPNKVLAAQLYQEFKEFFPENAVHYFVSYYDYYQPEAYIPQTDTYIEKDAKINDLLDQLRHATTADVLSRRDTIVVASVSCIYGIGDPEEYEAVSLHIKVGTKISRLELLRGLVLLQYHRNNYDPVRGEFRPRGDEIEVWLPHGTEKIIIALAGNKVSEISRVPLAFKTRDPRLPRYQLQEIKIFPAKHFVTGPKKMALAIQNIKSELEEELAKLKKEGRLLEAERLSQRTLYDIELLGETGYCPGIENYSRHLSFRKPGQPPYTLIDYFSKDFLLVIDESHIAIPQLRAMAHGDRARKEMLVKYGFRLPSAIDNRPLFFEEFRRKIGPVIYASATPRPYERAQAGRQGVVEQIIRPTAIPDPEVEIRPTKNQIDDLVNEIEARVKRKEKILVLTLTKRLAEDLAEYLASQKLRVHWLHSEIKTLLRPELLADLRKGVVDVLVGINLLREGLDLPEVSLVVILDADREGFLRNETTLIQTMGRAARHARGKVILYADEITGSISRAVKETQRRRKIQLAYNKTHHLKPQSISKPIRPSLAGEASLVENTLRQQEGATINKLNKASPKQKQTLIKALEEEMWLAAKGWDFERAARIRNQIQKYS